MFLATSLCDDEALVLKEQHPNLKYQAFYQSVSQFQQQVEKLLYLSISPQ
jgi:hypothetical protein